MSWQSPQSIAKPYASVSYLCNAVLFQMILFNLCFQVPITVPINSTTVNGTSCEVSYSLTQSGQATTGSGDNRDYVAFLQLTLANSATNAPIAVPYTLTVNNTNYIGVTQSSGMNLTDSTAQSGLITGNVGDYWNTLWPAATNNVTVSMVLQGNDANLAPSQVSWLHQLSKVFSRPVFICNKGC